MSELRPLERADLGTIGSLLVRAFNAARADDKDLLRIPPLCRNEYLRLYCDDGAGLSWVYVSDGNIHGVIFGHLRGQLAWIGPLAVSPRMQNSGIGKALVGQAVDCFKRRGCCTIGLEAYPLSARNLGFYAKLGFHGSALTLDLLGRPSTQAQQHAWTILQYSTLGLAKRADFMQKVSELTAQVIPEVDYGGLINLLEDYHFGESFLFYAQGRLVAYASLQTGAVFAGEPSGLMRLLAMVVQPSESWHQVSGLMRWLCNSQRMSGRLMVRFSALHQDLVELLLQQDWQVSDYGARMHLKSFPERTDLNGLHFSRLE